MALKLGDIAPDFTAESTAGKIRFHEWMGDKWAMLFSHPGAYTGVCTTELISLARLQTEFEKRNVKIIGLTVDVQESYRGWFKDIKDISGETISFPMVCDGQKEVAGHYGMVHPKDHQTYTVRSLYLVAPNKKIRLIQVYPASLGRNFEEILRAIDSLQLTENFQVGTPASWKPGGDCIIMPAVTDAELAFKFPKGYREVKPYLRYTPQPNR